jgi:ribosomal protein S6--L-glutamate ligase
MRVMIVYGRALDDNVKQLYSACKRHFGKPVLTQIMDLSAYIGSDGSKFWQADRPLDQVDVCFLRSFGPGSCEQVTKRVSMMEHLELSGTFMINSTYAYRKTKDKYSMTYTLARAGLAVPKTYVTEMAHWAYRASQGLGQTVYKPIVGSLGFGSMKFDNVDMAFNAYARLERLGQPLYIQEYLAKPNRDIRAFVIGDDVVASMYREVSLQEWRTNVAQGAKTYPAELSTEIQELAVESARTLNLLYAGVDILEASQGPVVSEVNAAPSWQGLQRTTGVNISDKLAAYASDHVKK